MTNRFHLQIKMFNILTVMPENNF